MAPCGADVYVCRQRTSEEILFSERFCSDRHGRRAAVDARLIARDSCCGEETAGEGDGREDNLQYGR